MKQNVKHLVFNFSKLRNSLLFFESQNGMFFIPATYKEITKKLELKSSSDINIHDDVKRFCGEEVSVADLI